MKAEKWPHLMPRVIATHVRSLFQTHCQRLLAKQVYAFSEAAATVVQASHQRFKAPADYLASQGSAWPLPAEGGVSLHHLRCSP